MIFLGEGGAGEAEPEFSLGEEGEDLSFLGGVGDAGEVAPLPLALGLGMMPVNFDVGNSIYELIRRFFANIVLLGEALLEFVGVAVVVELSALVFLGRDIVFPALVVPQ